MKKIILLVVCVFAATVLNMSASVTIRFWDNGVLIRDTAVIDSQGEKTLTGYYNKTALETAGYLKACTGYKFVGWKPSTPLMDERICADDYSAGVRGTINIATQDIDLYAVYKKDSVCYTRSSVLTAGSDYLIVGYNSAEDKYYAMRGDNDANVKTTEDAYKMSGLYTDEVAICGTDTIYSTNKRQVWKLQSSDNTNWTCQNQGNTGNYLRLDASISSILFIIGSANYMKNMLGSSNAMTITISNGVVSIGNTQDIALFSGSTNNSIFFAPEIKYTDYFGEQKSNVFLACIPTKNTPHLFGPTTVDVVEDTLLSGANITKGNIYLYKAVTEKRYKCKCGSYSVNFEACGDNSCGSDFSMSRLVKSEDSYSSGCHGLLRFTGVDTTNVRPIIGCPRRWKFKGWATEPCEEGGTPKYISANPYPLICQNETLYAVYRHVTRGVEDYLSSYPDCQQYTVTFEPVNGALVGVSPQTEATAGEGVTVPSAEFSTCSDWTFEGWGAMPCRGANANPGGLTKTSPYYPAVDGETLYAVYKKDSYWTSYPWCTPAEITLHAGTGTVGGNQTMSASEAPANSGVTLSVDAEFNDCSGWTFAGWSETQISSNTTIKPTMYVHNALYRPVTQNADVLYAVYRRAIGSSDSLWTSQPNCNLLHIVLHACGTDDCSASKIDDENPNTKTIAETAQGAGVELPAAVSLCSRWDFVGWHKGNPIEHKYTEPADLYATGFRYVPSSDNEALYAVYGHNTNTPGVYDYWTSNPDCTPYSVILHSCEGTHSGVMELDTMETVVGQGIELPAAIPLCDARGWQFYGWVEGGELSTTTDISGLRIYSAGEFYKPIRDNMHLYAVYYEEGFREVTSSNELNNNDTYVITFNWDYGNAYPFSYFALSTQTYTANNKSYLSLTPVSDFKNEHGDLYVSKPDSTCLWKLTETNYGWQVQNVKSGQYLYSPQNGDRTYMNGSSLSYVIEIDNHRMGRSGANYNYKYLHFLNVNLQNFYLLQQSTADKCYLFRQMGAVYSSWPHCAEYTVYFDGCDGIADVEGRIKKEDEAGMGVVMPDVTDYCSTPALGGWQFAGWATAPELEQTDNLTQHLYPVGTTYIPTKDNITLYAVYYIPKDSFELVSSQDDLYFGRNYIVVNSNKNRAMGNTHYNNGSYRISAVDVSSTNGIINSSNNAIRWRLQGRGSLYQFYNPSAGSNPQGRYMDMVKVSGYASLQQASEDNFTITAQNNSAFYVKSTSRINNQYLGGGNNYFTSYNSAQNIYFYRQKASYWSYPCSKPVEAMCWGDSTAIVESLTISGAPTSGSAVISNISVGENGTYVIKHFSRPGRRMRFKWGDNYYRLTVPYIVTPTYRPAVENLPNYDLVILPNSQMTLEMNTWFHTVSVYEDASLVIAQGDTLFVDTLYLRSNGPDKHPRVAFGGDEAAIVVNSGVIYHDHRFDDRAYYPLSLPYDANASQVRYAGLISEEAIPVPVKGSNFWLKYYDGEQRAQDANDGVDMRYKTYWEHIDGNDIKGGVGYSIGLADNTVGNHKERTMRFKLTPNDGEKYILASRDTAITIKPSLVSDENKKHHSGWNFIGNPYVCTFYPGALDENSGLLCGHFELNGSGKWQYNTSENVPYLTFYDASAEDYYQTRSDNSRMMPFSTAFIQVEDAEKDMLFYQTPMFADETPSPAPVRRSQYDMNRVVKAGILLYNQNAVNGGALSYDETGLVISNRYTNEYEVGADLVKMSNPRQLHVYTKNATHSLAFNALDEASAALPIPVGVSVPQTASYTFCFDDRQYDREELEALWLTDYEKGESTNLLEDVYTCTINKGTNEERFVLNAILRKHDTPTDMDAVASNGLQVLTHEDGSMTVCSSDILTDLAVYDIAGRLVAEWMPNAYQWTMSLPQGVYVISAKRENNPITHIKVCSK